MSLELQSELWHKVGKNEQCDPQDIVSKDIHIRWDGDRMEISKNGAISKDQFIDAITKLFQNIDKIIGEK